MIVEDFETFAARHGAGRNRFGEAGLHKRGHMSDAAHRRAVRDMLAKDRETATRRQALWSEYAGMLERGETREPTRQERMVEAAIGHPDLASTQAARRICEKNGWAA